MPHWAKLNIAPIDFQAISYYSAPKAKYASLDEVPQELLDTYEKLGVPLHERAKLAGVAVDAVFDSVSVGTTFRKELAEKGVIFCSMSEAIREHPELVQAVPRQRRADRRQLLRRAQLGGVLRRQLRVHPQGRALPDGAEHLLPHQRRPHRPVRAHPDHRRGQEPTCPTSKAAPRRCATRTSCTRRWSSWSRWTTPRSSTSTVQNWYPGDENGVGGIYNFVTKRGECRGARSKITLDPGRDRLGDHLEVPELRAARRRLDRRVPLGRADPPPPAGRHRHQDDPHRQAHQVEDRQQGHQRRPRPEHLPRPGQGRAQRRGRAQPHPVRLAADRQEVRRAHLPVHRGEAPDARRRARSDHLEDQRRPAVLLPRARHRARKTRCR